MRLVSACYPYFDPFDELNGVNDCVGTEHPADLTEGDILIVWGGADIWPGYYNRDLSPKSHAGTKPSERDRCEWELMQEAVRQGLPIIGVCRGAQMLCALAGGYLMQHVTGHSGQHLVHTSEGEDILVNSIHHQMMVPDGTRHTILAEIPAHSLRSTEYWDEDRKVDHKQEPEFIYFNDVNGWAVQWHPEMMETSSKANQYLLKVLNEQITARSTSRV